VPSRRLLVLNVALGLVSLAFTVGIVRTLLIRHPLPAAAVPRAITTPPPPAVTAPSEGGQETYASIVAQNLFNPARNESATSVAAVAVVKPILHGIVIEGSRSRAFLEDPSAKRVVGYSVGDPVSGGRLQKIADDRVVIVRPEGMVEVLLQDPSKPRPAPTAIPVTAVPGQPVPGQPAAAGQVPPVQIPPGQVPPQVPAGQMVPVQVAPGSGAPPAPGAAATSPSLIPAQSRRRVPPGQAPQ
jgi:hypothetical protein